MKKLLYIFLLPISLWGCGSNNDPRQYVGEADLTYLRGKTIYKALAGTNSHELNILFTDSTAVTIYSSDCWMIIRKQ